MSHIVFMGTPEFAVPVLDALARSRHAVVGVFTQPDQPAGRGQKLHASPVKRYAETAGIAVLQPKSLRTPEAYQALCNLAPDLVIVAAYGLILPAEVLACPPLGVSIHTPRCCRGNRGRRSDHGGNTVGRSRNW